MGSVVPSLAAELKVQGPAQVVAPQRARSVNHDCVTSLDRRQTFVEYFEMGGGDGGGGVVVMILVVLW